MNFESVRWIGIRRNRPVTMEMADRLDAHGYFGLAEIARKYAIDRPRRRQRLWWHIRFFVLAALQFDFNHPRVQKLVAERPFEPRQGAAETAAEDGVTPVDSQRAAPRAEGGRTAIAKELGRVEARLAYAVRALQAIVDAPMYGDDEGFRDLERGDIARRAIADLARPEDAE